MDDLKKRFDNLLPIMKKVKNLTEMARETGVSRQSLYNMAAGSVPKVETMELVVKYLEKYRGELNA